MHDELTEVDIQKMKEEFDYRQTVLTPKLIEALRHARELGDLSENDEYRSAKRELSANYGRMRYLYNMIQTAVVISVESEADRVGLFDLVEVLNTEKDTVNKFRIVTTLRNDVLNGLISKESPFGKAVLGHRVGDEVEIVVNETHSYNVQILSIEKGKDDPSIDINRY